MPGLNGRPLHVEVRLWGSGGSGTTKKSHRPFLVPFCPHAFIRTNFQPFNVLSFLS